MVKGQVARLETLATGDVRLKIDVPFERIPDDVITWVGQDIILVTRQDLENGTLAESLTVQAKVA